MKNNYKEQSQSHELFGGKSGSKNQQHRKKQEFKIGWQIMR